MKACLGLQDQLQRWLIHMPGSQFIFGKRSQFFLGGLLFGLLECPHDMVVGFP